MYVATLAALGALLPHAVALRELEDDLEEAVILEVASKPRVERAEHVAKVRFDASEYVKLNPEDQDALTPRYSDEILQPHLGALGESAMEVNNTESSECKGGLNEPEMELGKGEYGTVYKVSTNTSLKKNREYYALKVPNDNDTHTLRVAQHEIEVMEAVNQDIKAGKPGCSYAHPMLDQNPCVGGKIYKNAIVMPLMNWDLEKYKDSIPHKCANKVMNAVLHGLTCMHRAGYVHTDVRADNIWFHRFDDDKCPDGLEVADFGLSKKIGEVHRKYEREWYLRSTHLPGDVFKGAPEHLKISATVTYEGQSGKESAEGFKVDARVDLCSLASLVYKLFNIKSPVLQEELGGAGKCGMMGHGREWELP